MTDIQTFIEAEGRAKQVADVIAICIFSMNCIRESIVIFINYGNRSNNGSIGSLIK